jgi:dTMP kinase
MFITLEGPDGSGKTTQFHMLKDWLQSRGRDVLALREPGGTQLGEEIRELLLGLREGAPMHARTELLLFCASRAQLVVEKIKPHLAHGGIVLCDRFADCTLAYQGYGRGLDLAELKTILRFATQGIVPNLTLYFDVDAETGLARRSKGGDVNRLDRESIDFHRRVRAGYLEMVAAEPDRWAVIDASMDIQSVFMSVCKQIAI